MNLFEKKHIDNIESLKNYYDKFNIIKKKIFNKNLSIVNLSKIKDFNDEIFDNKIILLNLGKGKNEINKTKETLLKLFKRLDDISNIIFGNDNLNDKFLSFTQKDEIENKKNEIILQLNNGKINLLDEDNFTLTNEINEISSKYSEYKKFNSYLESNIFIHYFNNEKQKILKKYKLKIISIDKNLGILKDTAKIFGEFF